MRYAEKTRQEERTLYFDVEDSSDSLPGTEQNISVARTEGMRFSFMVISPPLSRGNTSSPPGSWCGEDSGCPSES